MGAADVVPGVSGGTIAFITGIYKELLDTIKSFNLNLFKVLKNEGIGAAWKSINGWFLVSLFAGIATSIVSLAGIISGILNEEGETQAKISLWSFFFGLILASILYIGKQIKKWNAANIIGLILGAAIAYYITIAPVSGDSEGLLFLFFAGILAISAMILPGISGSFILVLLGAYQPVMNAISGLKDGIKEGNSELISSNGTIFLVILAGCIIGLLSFSRILSWLFKNHERLTLAVLTGFMFGSLNKIWPWKEVISTRISSKGEIKPVETANLSPENYEQLYNIDSGLMYAITFMVLGFLVVFGTEYFGEKMKKTSN